MEVVLTTHPGLEAVAFEELQARVGAAERRTDPAPGRVHANLDNAPAAGAFDALRITQDVLAPLAVRTLAEPTLEAVSAAMADVEAPSVAAATTFRVACQRHGKHPFSRVDVERKAGAALFRRYGTKVDLSNPETVVRADVIGDRLVVGCPLPRAAPRSPLPFVQRVGLKAEVAAAAVHISALEAPTRVLDPFCGSGRLLVEAGAVHPETELWGSDWTPSAALGAQDNLHAAGLGDRGRVHQMDFALVNEVFPAGSFDAVISNPPFGVRVGRRMNFFRFYMRMFETVTPLLREGGTLTVLTDRKTTFDKALATHGGFTLVRELHARIGDVSPWVVALSRR